MEHAALSTPLSEDALARLDHLIAEVSPSHDSQAGLLLEHLQSARAYLLGTMPEEYEFSLGTAKETAAKLSDAGLRKTVTQETGALLDQLAAGSTQTEAAPPRRSDLPLEDADKSELYRFFRGSPTTLGVFYPTHYIFASFPTFQRAKNAARALEVAGYRDVVAASAAETLRFMDEIKADVGLWGAMMASISRFFGTEEVFTDIGQYKAEEGAGFLAVYCPRAEQAKRIHDLVAPFEPLAMQLYLPDGIQSLHAGKSPGPQGNHPERN